MDGQERLPGEKSYPDRPAGEPRILSPPPLRGAYSFKGDREALGQAFSEGLPAALGVSRRCEPRLTLLPV